MTKPNVDPDELPDAGGVEMPVGGYGPSALAVLPWLVLLFLILTH